MTIHPPLCFHQMGQRANQEDSIFPALGCASTESHTFIVCDGMGGHENGEVASSTVCRSFEAFLNGINADDFSEAVFNRALAFAYDELDRIGAATNMGTTLTFLHLNSSGAFMAHIGDSRIYHLRSNDADGNMQIIYRSADHSLVNELLSSGIITEEEARNHPKKNVITRAMQPGDHCNADIHFTADICPGDYFFLCSDGVLESIDDATLSAILASDISDEEKLELIRNNCNTSSRDNNSAYLIHVATAELIDASTPDESASAPVPLAQDAETDDLTTPHRFSLDKKHIYLIAIIAVVLFIIYLLFDYFDVSKDDIVNFVKDIFKSDPATPKK